MDLLRVDFDVAEAPFLHRKPYTIGEWTAVLTLGGAIALVIILVGVRFIASFWHYLTPEIDPNLAVARSSAVSAIVATISLIAAVIAALVALISFRHNQDTSRRELRAYMSAKCTNIEHIFDNIGSIGANAIEFVTVWENVGSTPARKIVSSGGRAILPTDIPDDFNYGRIVFTGIFSETGPASTMHTTLRVEVADIRDAKNGGRLFVWAAVEYSDVFKNSRRHRTEVCHEVIFYGDPALKQTRISTRHRGRFNGSDDDSYYSPTPIGELRNTSTSRN